MHTKFDIYGSADSDSTEYMLHHLVVFEWPHLVSFYFTILIPIFTLAYYCGSEDFHIDSPSATIGITIFSIQNNEIWKYNKREWRYSILHW